MMRILKPTYILQTRVRHSTCRCIFFMKCLPYQGLFELEKEWAGTSPSGISWRYWFTLNGSLKLFEWRADLPSDTACITEPCLGVVLSGRNAQAQTWNDAVLICFKQKTLHTYAVYIPRADAFFNELTAIPRFCLNAPGLPKWDFCSTVNSQPH